MYNNADELNRKIKNRILLVGLSIFVFIISYILMNLMLKIYPTNSTLKVYPKDNLLSSLYSLIFVIFEILKLIIKNMLLTPLIIFTIFYFIFLINDFIFLIFIKFIKKIKEC